jgi:uncharacterized protein
MFERTLSTARNGDLDAHVTLSQIYLARKLAPKDLQQAVQWAEAAASKGYAADEYLLGLLYLWGTGATTDEMMAEKLFLKAEEKGFDAALAELSQIYMGKNRKALTDSLSGSSVKLNFRDAYF